MEHFDVFSSDIKHMKIVKIILLLIAKNTEIIEMTTSWKLQTQKTI